MPSTVFNLQVRSFTLMSSYSVVQSYIGLCLIGLVYGGTYRFITGDLTLFLSLMTVLVCLMVGAAVWILDYEEMVFDDSEGLRTVQILSCLVVWILVIEGLLFIGFFWILIYDFLIWYVTPTFLVHGKLY